MDSWMPDQTSSFDHTRRSFLATAGALGAVSLAGCVGDDDDEGDDGEVTIDLVLNPAEEGVDIEAQYLPVIDLLEDEFDVEVEGIPTASPDATVQELQRAGSGDRIIADTSPGAVFELGDDIEVIGTRVAFGGGLYFGTLATTPDSGIEEVPDLEGEQIATNGAAGSVSGGQAPLFLLQENGLDLGNVVDVGEAEDFDWVNADAHDVAINELIEDDDIMAAGSGEFVSVPHFPEGHLDERIAEAPPDVADRIEEFRDVSTEVANNLGRDTDVAELRLLDVSDPLPRAPLLTNSGWDDDLRDDIEEFLLGLEPDDFEHDAFDLADTLNLDIPDGLLEDWNDPDVSADPDEYDVDPEAWAEFNDNTLWFDGVREATAETYEPLREYRETLGIGE